MYYIIKNMNTDSDEDDLPPKKKKKLTPDEEKKINTKITNKTNIVNKKYNEILKLNLNSDITKFNADTFTSFIKKSSVAFVLIYTINSVIVQFTFTK